jgi:hypothetical protein
MCRASSTKTPWQTELQSLLAWSLLLGLASCAANGGKPGLRGPDATNPPMTALVGKAGTAAGAPATLLGQAGNTTNAPASASAGSATSDAGASRTVGQRPPAAGCASNALDQVDCPCDRAGATRPCYSADAITRNIGICKDGLQTCVADKATEEFSQAHWGPCQDQVIPTVCSNQLDARCVGKVGCADEQCADKLGCAKDAGMPDAGRGHCHTVMGFGVGTGFFPGGGMWCER